MTGYVMVVKLPDSDEQEAARASKFLTEAMRPMNGEVFTFEAKFFEMCWCPHPVERPRLAWSRGSGAEHEAPRPSRRTRR